MTRTSGIHALRSAAIATGLAAALALISITYGQGVQASATGTEPSAAEQVAPVTSGGELPPESHNVELVGHADPGTGFNADVVVHRRIAYVGSWGHRESQSCPALGVRAFDLAEPSDPQHVSTFADGQSEPMLADSWTEKVVVASVAGPAFRGGLAAVSFQACRPGGFRGFGLYDVSRPAQPVPLAHVPLEAGDSEWGMHELWLDVRRGTAYVHTAVTLSELLTSPAPGQPGTPDYQIWDVSDPTAPAKVGEWGAWAELGIPPVSIDDQGVTRISFVHSVVGAVVGQQHRAYLTYYDSGTVILDVSDPSSPRFLGRTEYAPHEQGNAHSAWLARGGTVLIQTDEVFAFEPPDDPVEHAWGYTRIFDVRDPSDPVPLSTFEMPSTRQFPPPGPGLFTAHTAKVRGGTLFVSWYTEGVVVVDISDPANPTQVGQFVPPPAADPQGFFFPGEELPIVWGVAVDGDVVVASDINSGLWVFRVTH